MAFSSCRALCLPPSLRLQLRRSAALLARMTLSQVNSGVSVERRLHDEHTPHDTLLLRCTTTGWHRTGPHHCTCNTSLDAQLISCRRHVVQQHTGHLHRPHTFGQETPPRSLRDGAALPPRLSLGAAAEQSGAWSLRRPLWHTSTICDGRSSSFQAAAAARLPRMVKSWRRACGASLGCGHQVDHTISLSPRTCCLHSRSHAHRRHAWPVPYVIQGVIYLENTTAAQVSRERSLAAY